MTFHEHLQMYQKFDQIPFGKDKGNSNSTFVQNSTCNAANFEFLNLSPKTILQSLKNSTTFILGIPSFDLYISGNF
jgi:hypothetical protein